MRAARIIVPILLIVLAWLAAAGVGGPYFGRISEVASNDQASYLPASSEATQVSELLPEFAGGDDIPAIVVFARDGGLTDADREYAQSFADSLATTEGIGDGRQPADRVGRRRGDRGLRADLRRPRRHRRGVCAPSWIRPRALGAWVTGPAGFTADLVEAFSGIDGLLLLVALGAVFLILLIVYRSPLLPLIVLGTAVFALSAAILAVWWLAYADIVRINGQVQGILFILVIGAATDYALLYVARYREALHTHERAVGCDLGRAPRGRSSRSSRRRGTVIAGLLCLLFSDLNSNKALGPVAAIGIAFALLAALTLLPALLLAAGRAAFWPFRPKFDAADVAVDPAQRATEGNGLWARVTRLIARHARLVWIASTVVLLVRRPRASPSCRPTASPQSELVLGHSEARDGQEVLGEHFPAGSGSPALIVGAEDDLTALADAAAARRRGRLGRRALGQLADRHDAGRDGCGAVPDPDLRAARADGGRRAGHAPGDADRRARLGGGRADRARPPGRRARGRSGRARRRRDGDRARHERHVDPRPHGHHPDRARS